MSELRIHVSCRARTGRINGHASHLQDRRYTSLLSMFPVVIEFRPPKAGDVAFACGMNMPKGVTVVP
jgi:hypothetical protein